MGAAAICAKIGATPLGAGPADSDAGIKFQNVRRVSNGEQWGDAHFYWVPAITQMCSW